MGKIEKTAYFYPNFFLVTYPKWYLTSPADNKSSELDCFFSRNYWKIACAGLSNIQWRVLSLPRWAIPKTTYSAPYFVTAYSKRQPIAEIPEFKP